MEWIWSTDRTYGHLTDSPSSGASTFTVATDQGTFPSPGPGQQFALLINPDLSALADNATTEEVVVIGVSGSTFTIAGTLAHSHSSSETVVLVIPTKMLQLLAAPLVVNCEAPASGLTSLAITSQPLVRLGSGILQQLPPLFGFSFDGLNPTIVTSTIPGTANLQGIGAGPDHLVWTCDNNLSAPNVYGITLTGVVSVTAALATGANPTNPVTGSDGNIWVADQGRGSFWRITPSTDPSPGTTTEFTLAGPATPYQICAGSDGRLWAGDIDNNQFWFIDTAGTPGSIAYTPGPAGICAGPDGNIWGCSIDGHIAIVDPVAETVIQTIDASGTAVTIQTMCTGPDGNVWLADESGQAIRVTPSGVITAFALAGSSPFAITSGPGGDIWVTDENGAIWKITPLGEVTSFPTPATVPATWLCVGGDGSFWITLGTVTAAILVMPFNLTAGGDVDFTTTNRGPVLIDRVTGSPVRILSTSGVLSTESA